MPYSPWQHFNWQGIYYTAKAIFQPALLRPSYVVQNINDIPFKQLEESGIEALCFDKDNCITLPYQRALHPSIEVG